MRGKILFLVIQLSFIQAFGQNPPDYHPPLDIPMILSGNFGELRPDHFHSGIDIKTLGTIGQRVLAINEGYVSRIKVQANGYGKSIYLAHPDGHTSVYGHLDRYRDDIADYVRSVQYSRRAHQVDIYVEPGQFRVEKGELIAYSGNTGGSFGPHLHLEIRNTGNQNPTNVLSYGFNIGDHVAPKFSTLFLKPLGDGAHVNGSSGKQAFNLVLDHGVYTVPWGTRVEAAGDMVMAVEVFDYLDGASNRCGIYSLEVYAGEQLTYSLIMDEFAFSESRYVNAHMDFEEHVASGKTVHRLYRLPNDRLRIYGHLENDGILNIPEGKTVPVRIVATDVSGNRSELEFSIRGTGKKIFPPVKQDDVRQLMHYDRTNVFEEQGVKVELPPLALYEDIDFRFSRTGAPDHSLSPFYNIHDPGTPLQLPYTLSVIAPEVDPRLRSKMVFTGFDPDEEKYISFGGTYNQGWLTASLQVFGSFTIALDTIAPVISPANGPVSGDLRGKDRIAFTVRDDLSEIDAYDGYINNQWALFEYDPKNDLLSYTFDGSRLDRGQEHELEIYVKDARGNVNLFHTIFTW
jgi:hypothetical protein